MTPHHRISAPFPPGARREAGFTLIELMIVVVIATILATIALPMYLGQLRESRRTEARNYLVELAAREERFFATQNAYTNGASNMGYSSWGSGNPVGSGYYYINQPNVPDPSAPAGGPPSYSLVAKPEAGKGQDKDTTCQSFTIESNGTRSSKDGSGNDTSATCWPSQ
ncbi:MAG TPA: type IV pilin protein [Steroidobacteraceae bacterium]|nr:type IV pilin protein [Steroidobacteraceae bacterium]